MFEKYKSIIFYFIFGALATAINIGAYTLCYEMLNIQNVPSNIIAWATAVIFAFITNKIWVFESKIFVIKKLFNELCKFITARLITGIIDVLIMYISVDVLQAPAVIFKVISNIIVIILNYLLSKFIVFKKAD